MNVNLACVHVNAFELLAIKNTVVIFSAGFLFLFCSFLSCSLETEIEHRLFSWEFQYRDNTDTH